MFFQIVIVIIIIILVLFLIIITMIIMITLDRARRNWSKRISAPSYHNLIRQSHHDSDGNDDDNDENYNNDEVEKEGEDVGTPWADAAVAGL